MEVFPELEVPFRKTNIPCVNLIIPPKIIVAYPSVSVTFTQFTKLSNSENIRETIGISWQLVHRAAEEALLPQLFAPCTVSSVIGSSLLCKPQVIFSFIFTKK